MVHVSHMHVTRLDTWIDRPVRSSAAHESRTSPISYIVQ
jgi:hypothetical protein